MVICIEATLIYESMVICNEATLTYESMVICNEATLIYESIVICIEATLTMQIHNSGEKHRFSYQVLYYINYFEQEILQ